VRRLRSAIDLLAQIDPSDLTTAELADDCLELQRQRHRLDGITTRLLNPWQHSGVWACDGSRSPASRLARETRSSISSCRGHLRRSAAAAHLPAVVDAIIAGELSIDHLDLFAAKRTPERAWAMDRDQRDLVASCTTLNFAQARTLLDYWAATHDDQASGSDAPRPDTGSRVFLSETFEGAWVLDGTLDALSGGIVANELIRLDRQLAEHDASAGVTRTPAQRRAAALALMAQRSASLPDNSQPARPLFTVLVGADTLNRLCELAEGTVLTPSQLVPWLTSADLETIIFDGPHTIISVSHKRRFTGAIRRAIEVRDRRCTHPSDCDVPASRCDIDHIIPYAEHGPTSQFNGRLQCPTHNRNQTRHATSPQQPIAPHRQLTELDHIRARLRYAYLNNDNDEPPDPQPQRATKYLA
jgi:hypothetical protein